MAHKHKNSDAPDTGRIGPLRFLTSINPPDEVFYTSKRASVWTQMGAMLALYVALIVAWNAAAFYVDNQILLPSYEDLLRGFHNVFKERTLEGGRRIIHCNNPFPSICVGDYESVWGHIGVSAVRIAVSFLMGVALGVVAAAYAASSRLWGPAVESVVHLLNGTPAIIFAALGALWGLWGTQAVIVFGASSAFFQTYRIMFSCLKNGTEMREVVSAAQVDGATRMQALFQVAVPACREHLFGAMQISFAQGASRAYFAEYLLASESGLGPLLNHAVSGTMVEAYAVIFLMLGILVGGQILLGLLITIWENADRIARLLGRT